jgi:hypothetical protein
MPLHPDCLGLFGTDGTVESYLEAQGTLSYFRYDQVYSAVYKKIIGKLSGLKSAGEARDHAADPEAGGRVIAAPGSLLSPWLDVDASVASYCRRKRRKKPENLAELIKTHIQVLEDWIARI